MSETGNICETEHSAKRTISESNNFADSYILFISPSDDLHNLRLKLKCHYITYTLQILRQTIQSQSYSNIYITVIRIHIPYQTITAEITHHQKQNY